MHRILVALLASSPLVTAAQDASPVPGDPPAASPAADAMAAAAEPGGVYLGVGFGPTVLSGDRVGSGFRIRVGAARSPRVAFGFEGGLASNDAGQLGSYDVGVTFFPWERFLYLRGAAGLSTVAFRNGPDERGANVLVGLGVAFGSARGPNLTVNLEAQHHRTSAAGNFFVESGASIASAWLGFEWR